MDYFYGSGGTGGGDGYYEELIKAFCTDYYWYYGYADYQSCVDGLMDYFYGSGGSTGGDGY